jgi:multidrug efflux pump subunit AcrA (membrane-fusion protein)
MQPTDDTNPARPDPKNIIEAKPASPPSPPVDPETEAWRVDEGAPIERSQAEDNGKGKGDDRNGGKRREEQGERKPEDEETRKRRGHLVRMAAIVAGIAFACLLIYTLISRHREGAKLASEVKTKKSQLPTVSVVKPNNVSQSALTLPGSTQAIEDAVIGARSTGYVRHRYVDIGSRVRAGQLLADIEAPDVDVQLVQARAQQAQARAIVRQSQSDVANRRATVAQLAANVAQAQATVQQDRAQLAEAEARLTEAQHNVDIARAALVQAQAQAELAAKTVARYRTLLEYGYVALQDVDQSQASYDTERAAVRSAESNVAAQQAEAAADVATATSYEKLVRAAEATVASNEAAVRAGQANVRTGQAIVVANQYGLSANAANTQRAAVLAGFDRVIAPFDGVITARNFDVGSLINAGGGAAGSTSGPSSASASGSSSTTSSSSTVGSASIGTSQPATTPGTGLFGIAKIDVLRILVNVPQAFMTQIHPGLTTHIMFNEYPGRTFAGTVFYVSGALDTTSRTLLAEVHVSNTRSELLPGMYAQVQFDLSASRPVVHIPADTLIVDAQGTRVVAVTPQKKLNFVPIKLGRDFGADIEVQEGLTGQETLVSNPSDDLYEGEEVTPQAPAPQPGQQPPGRQTGHPGRAASGGGSNR